MGRKIVRGLRYLALGSWAAFSLFVIGWIVLSSFKTNRELFANIWSLPQKFSLENYLSVWQSNQIGRSFFNSLMVVLPAVTGILLLAAPAAYVLARIENRVLRAIGNFFSFGLGIPHQLILIPLFFMLLRAGLIGSLAGIVLVYVALSLPFSIFLLSSFYRNIPREMEESTLLDGCSPAAAFWRVILPASKAGLIPCAMLNIIGLWNELLLVLTFINDSKQYTLSLGLYALQGALQYTGNWVGLFAAFVVVVLPTFILFTFLSKAIVAGMTAGVSK